MSIAQNTASIRERIASAAHRCGRNSDEITLMAVSKTHPPELIREAYGAGVRVFGENRVQEFSGKAAALADLKDAEWHLIGHLQSNKTRRAAELFQVIQTVDAVKLARRLDGEGKPVEVMLEVKLSPEQTKAGTDPESLDELVGALQDERRHRAHRAPTGRARWADGARHDRPCGVARACARNARAVGHRAPARAAHPARDGQPARAKAA